MKSAQAPWWFLVSLVLLPTLQPPTLAAQIQPETISNKTLGDPEASWFIAKATMGTSFVFDATDGSMLGTLSTNPFTPAVERHPVRAEIYAAESHYTRRTYGTRNDILTVFDHANLAPIAEIDLPDKIGSLNFAEYISVLGDQRHLTVFNMTPAQSVSVVDLEARKFVGELSTPGCALTMATGERGFLMMCGDGTLQLIRLDDKGAETSRVRSKPFFSIDKDPVFDQPVLTRQGWQMVSFEGQVFTVATQDDEITISKPWSLLTEADREDKWRVGGGQIMGVHHALDLLYVLMHQGGVDTHEDPGTEVWVFSRSSRQRIARLPLAKPSRSILVTQDEQPRLIASAAEEPTLDIYDARKLVHQQTVELGMVVGLLAAY